MHGVWPPPEEEFIGSRMPGGSRQRDFPRSHYPSRGQTFPDPFYPHHHRPFSGFEFTDPFTLFNSIFEGTPFQSGPSRSRHHSYSRSPFEHMHRMQAEIESFMDDIDRDPFSMGGMGPRFGFGPMLAMPSLPSPNGRGRWVSESVVSSTVNGVTQTVRKRVDSNVSPVGEFSYMFFVLTIHLPTYRVMNISLALCPMDVRSALSTESSNLQTSICLK